MVGATPAGSEVDATPNDRAPAGRRERSARPLLALALAAVSCSEWPDPRASSSEASAFHVLQTTHRFTTRLVTVRTESSTLVTTLNHPFAKVDAGWTPAARLAVGDRIHIRGSAVGTQVLGLSVREAPATPVYNLTVERTHAYFVGPEDLLVHNINCFGWTRRRGDPRSETQAPARTTLAELLAEERKKERATLAELLAKERQKEREAKLAVPRKTDRFIDTRQGGECTACSMASLGDFDSLSDFLDAHSDKRDAEGRMIVAQSLRGLHEAEIKEMMKLIGLRSDTTPEPEEFPKSGGHRGARFKKWRKVEEFARNSGSNTFVVAYQYTRADGTNGGHSVVAIRKDDGTLVFIDYSLTPPKIVDIKSLKIWSITLIPTDVDWHDNRHVNDALKAHPSG